MIEKLIKKISSIIPTKKNRTVKYLLSRGIKRHEFVIIDKEKISFPKFNITISLSTHNYVVVGFRDLKKIFSLPNVHASTEANTLIITIDGLVFSVKNCEELFILREIFVEDIYNFHYQEPVILIDIGMNVGIASLFFASKPYVEKVYSYEPFKKTYEFGLKNFLLNPAFSRKIEPHMFGWASKNSEVDWKYSPDYPGNCGIKPVPDYVLKKDNLEVEKVQLRNCIDALEEIVKNNTSMDLVMKIDCEGSEYEIINALVNSSSFTSVKIILLEWHLRGEKPILDSLLPLGFKCIATCSEDPGVGMIYAFR